jgi:hypothetical protein
LSALSLLPVFAVHAALPLAPWNPEVVTGGLCPSHPSDYTDEVGPLAVTLSTLALRQSTNWGTVNRTNREERSSLQLSGRHAWVGTSLGNKNRAVTPPYPLSYSSSCVQRERGENDTA